MSQTESSSASSSISLIKLDELSSFGATRQNRLPALIRLNEIDQNIKQQPAVANSMPIFSSTQIENTQDKTQQSLPINLQPKITTPTPTTSDNMNTNNNNNSQAEKENVDVVVAHQVVSSESQALDQQQDDILKPSTNEQQQQQQQAGLQQQNSQQNKDDCGDFQVVDMEQVVDESSIGVGPSLPQSTGVNKDQPPPPSQQQLEKSLQALQASQLFNQQQQQHSSTTSHLGDSLIEMIINLRNENQNLIKALETNNDYVKDRLSEFKRIQDETRQREAQFALEKADHEHHIRKLQRQNTVLSERLKSMEVKLKEMKLDVSESLSAANSSKVSSVRGQDQTNLYPELSADLDGTFSNLAYQNQPSTSVAEVATTMQVDAASGELYNDGDDNNKDKSLSSSSDSNDDDNNQDMQTDATPASRIANMTKEELEKYFDAEKVKFNAIDDPMKQCDKLEQQLNEIGKRDYEICLFQQQLNIYRQDFRLERMANFEAKIQIEKLKTDIDKLCLERIHEQRAHETRAKELATSGEPGHKFGGAPENLIGRLGRKAAKSAAKSAAKAAKYAAKQAHLEEKAAKAMARVAGAANSPPSHHNRHNHHHQHNHHQAHHAGQPSTAPSAPGPEPVVGGGDGGEYHHQHHHLGGRRGHRHHHQQQHHIGGRPKANGIRSEMVNDLLSTANKAMLTGYKMASTHVNLALDKLSQYEQEQRDNLEKSKQQSATPTTTTTKAGPSAPSMQPPSID